MNKSRYPYTNYEELKQYKNANKDYIDAGKALYKHKDCIIIK